MQYFILQSRYFRSAGSKALMALVFTSVISGLSISPALADNDGGHGNQGQRGRQGHNDQRGWRGDRGGYGYEYRQPYVYAQPVYIPPPVYYEPRQSPGISLFFPLDIRR